VYCVLLRVMTLTLGPRAPPMLLTGDRIFEFVRGHNAPRHLLILHGGKRDIFISCASSLSFYRKSLEGAPLIPLNVLFKRNPTKSVPPKKDFSYSDNSKKKIPSRDLSIGGVRDRAGRFSERAKRPERISDPHKGDTQYLGV
jgi:hypothetical protein